MTKVLPNPIRLRPATENSIGTAAFFRNRPLFDTLLSRLKNDAGDSYRVLFHACSIGSEVYSLVARYLLQKYNGEYALTCFATDQEKDFIEYASNAQYPAVVLDGMSEDEKNFFAIQNGYAQILSKVKSFVEFLAPSDFSVFYPTAPYDVVFLLNALVYVPAEVQEKTLENISKYNSRYLVVTAFHADTIQKDLEKNGYKPVLENQELIHESWLDRRVEMHGDVRTSQIFADWRLPPFSEIEEHEFRYCALFEKC